MLGRNDLKEPMALSIEDFMERLESISNNNGRPYDRAYLLFDAEDEHNQKVLQFQGYLALSDAFKCFFLETIELINTLSRPKIKTNISEFYGIFIPRLTLGFKTLCATERTANSGYPLQAYSLLRNTFDDTVLTSACLQKFTDFYSIEGLIAGKKLDVTAIKKNRKKTEFKVRQIMTGSKSGLSQETQNQLSHWDNMFDLEVHGGRLSISASKDWLKGTKPLPVLPQFDKNEFAIFMNRHSEIGWMLHRLIPALQPKDIPLPTAWTDKWHALDESFEQTVNALTQQLGKKIGAAIVEFVKIKFPFNPQFTFPY